MVKWKSNKRVSFSGNVRYLGAVLIVMQGILISLFAIFMVNSSYNNQWNKYLKTDHALNIYIQNVPVKRFCIMMRLKEISL
ncbi:hypothetical protein [Clostridium massiliodielmoense]|uniref:hypothetical protein n=1 Tax=Clostridium massiliodielmoense TaxID=1776385 RepID=UPI0004D50FFF|nr:hypothetical protein [Clostridium massiliodielmoense]KEH98081.1 hypothetical protein Z962_01120 [Clostridium botulinum C/D str. BKT12695]